MVYGDHGYGGIPARRGREVAGIILSMWFVAWMGVFFTSVARSQISITLDHTHHSHQPFFTSSLDFGGLRGINAKVVSMWISETIFTSNYVSLLVTELSHFHLDIIHN